MRSKIAAFITNSSQTHISLPILRLAGARRGRCRAYPTPKERAHSHMTQICNGGPKARNSAVPVAGSRGYRPTSQHRQFGGYLAACVGIGCVEGPPPPHRMVQNAKPGGFQTCRMVVTGAASPAKIAVARPMTGASAARCAFQIGCVMHSTRTDCPRQQGWMDICSQRSDRAQTRLRHLLQPFGRTRILCR